ncbi:MAG: hypothetical protein R3F37_03460 [Candidatus Competibacteraceae bacterium]
MRLENFGVSLKPGVDYRWYIALVRNPERRLGDLLQAAAFKYTRPLRNYQRP